MLKFVPAGIFAIIVTDRGDVGPGGLVRGEPLSSVQWCARRDGNAGIPGNHGIVESVSYRI